VKDSGVILLLLEVCIKSVMGLFMTIIVLMIGPDDVSDELPFGSLQFTVLEELNTLLDLDSNKGPGCVSAFALPFCLLFISVLRFS
jgi:hypothetical protein